LPAQVTYTPFEPAWAASAGSTGPNTAQVYPAETAAWRASDLLISVTTGTIVVPTGGTAASFTNATGALTPGPFLGLTASTPGVPFNIMTSSASVTQGAVTVAGAAQAGAPARTLYGVVTYAITATTESQNSQPFIINTAPGVGVTIVVASAGKPAGATTYIPYLGFAPNTWAAQAAATALGTPTGTIANPLTNSVGVNRAAAAVSSGIIGMANVDSDAYFGGILGATSGGSLNTGKRSLFGATQSYGPGWPNDAFALPVTKLQSGFYVCNLVQPWNNTLLSAAVGFNIDAGSGYFVADTTQTQAGTIDGLAYQPGGGNVNDIGARVRVKLLAAAVI
jgi:hypothetical protein